MNPTGVFRFDVEKIAGGFAVPAAEVVEHFQDGRNLTPLVERRFVAEVPGWTRRREHGGSRLAQGQDGRLWEIRSITKAGLALSPSRHRGVGRSFDAPDFVAYVSGLAGFLVFDAQKFPEVPYWVVPRRTVLDWWENKALGRAARLEREKFLTLLRES